MLYANAIKTSQFADYHFVLYPFLFSFQIITPAIFLQEPSIKFYGIIHVYPDENSFSYLVLLRSDYFERFADKTLR